VAHPDKVVVSITGDGGFMFGVQELATAVHHRIGLVTCVFNNDSYGNVRRDQLNNYQGHLIGAELTNPDFVKLSESFGVAAYRVHTPDQFGPALNKAIELDAPAVIEIVVERGSEVSPRPFLHPYR